VVVSMPCLLEVEVGVFAVEVVEEHHEVLQAPAQPIDRPRGDHVELSVHLCELLGDFR
jgi:hypothetical protein